MNDDERTQMERFGITCTTESRYHYQKFRYNKLSDAVNYAKIDSQKTGEDQSMKPPIALAVLAKL